MSKLKLKFSLLLSAMFISITASAYDFASDGIYYNILSEEDRTVEVTYREYYSYKGDVIIPSKVVSNSITYTVVAIGNDAFYEDRLASIEIPGSVTTIGDYAFKNCDNLASVIQHEGLRTIGYSAFYYCGNLASIKIPSSVTSIGNSAFYGCENLESAILHEGLTTIGDRAFYYCDKLASIDIPGSVTTIGDYAFERCGYLASVILHEGLTSIGESAFQYCSRLASIDIPGSVTTIGHYAFNNCDDLASVILHEGLRTIGGGAFQYCGSLALIDIPGSVTTIEGYAFYGCENLESAILHEGLTTIGYSAFYYCGNLASIDIPGSVTTIGDYAFYYCDNLTEVYCRATTPPTASNGVFISTTLMGTLYVPVGTKDAYMAVDPWRNFWNIEEVDFSSAVEVVEDDGIVVATSEGAIVVEGEQVGNVRVYSVNGQCVYSGTDTVIGGLAKGVYIVKVGNQTVKIIL